MGASYRGQIDDLERPPLTARINDGDRTIFREDAGADRFVDVVWPRVTFSPLAPLHNPC